MLFDFDFNTGLITIGYFKFLLESGVQWTTLFLGALMHLYTQWSIMCAKAKELKLKGAELAEYKKKAKREFITNKSVDFFEKAEKMAKTTKTKFDDKLFYYLKLFSKSYRDAFNALPTKEDVKHMKERAEALAHQDKKVKEEKKGEQE